MKEVYMVSEMESIVFDREDVITTSGEDKAVGTARITGMQRMSEHLDRLIDKQHSVADVDHRRKIG